MTPPTEYFRRCNADTPGAQRVGFDWFVFTDQDALWRALNDGMFDGGAGYLEQLAQAQRSIDALENQVAQLEQDLEEAQS